MSKDPLECWVRTTLWHAVKDGPPTLTHVWYPPETSEAERVALLARHAAQGVTVMRELTGPHAMIVQGQWWGGCV